MSLLAVEGTGVTWETIVLWNPAIREFKSLPSSPVERPPTENLYMYGCIGFGFDRNTNDYKVLRVVTDDHYPPEHHQIELYSLNSDSWREIPDVSFDHYHINSFETYNNGVYYWWAYDNIDHLIMSFDFATETFEKLPLPDCEGAWVEYAQETMYGVLAIRYDYHKVLCTFNGLPAVIFSPIQATEKLFDIWVMTEHGVKESWVKQMSIGPISGVEKPLGFCKNNGMFFEDSNKQQVLYDSNTQELKNLQFHGFQMSQGGLKVASYVESLVPIHGVGEDDDEPLIMSCYRELLFLDLLQAL
ncbi:F-box/kelch-repeat protein At3g06240-like [Tripterygium wilfordii]|uniref:F-box/kelch-repeat protein At3g06240-like n=1 Tax=Tripterygium wilfordii TaxID=458696 RepID=UPI0018F8009E|nr:F-box/kelch-repeat protein At3g06240-like [Tripterygium wilfordii]